MLVKNNPKLRQDEDGTWWYYFKEPWEGNPCGHRALCRVVTCHFCGTEFVNYPGKKQGHCSKTCAQRCQLGSCAVNYEKRLYRGENSKRWKGGRRVANGGYIEVFQPDHPSLKNTKRQYVRENRLVMEKILGRLLIPGEQVHHINGIRTDNRPENLQLLTTNNHPYGVVARCAVCGSHDIVFSPIPKEDIA